MSAYNETMPFALDARTNTYLLMDVAPSSATPEQYALQWPEKTPVTHGLLLGDANGVLQRKEQHVSALLGNLDNVFYGTTVLPVPATPGAVSAALTLAPAMTIRSYKNPVAIGVDIKLRAYLDNAPASTNDIAVVRISASIVNDPGATSLSQIWTSTDPVFFGEQSGLFTGLQIVLPRLRNNACTPQFVVTANVNGNAVRVNADVTVYLPYTSTVQGS